MKKFYTLFASLAFIFAANAANNKLTFFIGETPIENGSTVEFNELTVMQDFGDGWGEVKYEPKLFLTNDFYSSKIKVTAKCTSGESVMMCCGGACGSGVEVVKDNLKMQAASTLPLEFHWETDEIELAAVPEITVEFEAFDGSGKNSPASFTLVMKKNAGVENIAAAAYVRFSGKTLYYNVASASQLTLYSIIGTPVLSRNVSGNGSVSLDGLAKGCYIYSLAGKTGKIYVK